MNRAFYNGISGVKTQQFGIDTWGNNIANINTNGFKANIPQFADLFYNKLDQISNRTPTQSDQGFGSRVNASAISMKQGAVVITEKNFDVAIMGDGWFGVTNGRDDHMFFTRNGNFSFDLNNNLVTEDGTFVIGSLSEDVLDGKLKAISDFVSLADANKQTQLHLPKNLQLDAIVTKQVNLHGNLGVKDEIGKFSTHIFTKSGERNILNVEIQKDDKQPKIGSSWRLIATIKDENDKVIFTSKPSQILFNGSGSIAKYEKPQIDNGGTNIDLHLNDKYGEIVALDTNSIGKEVQSDGVPMGKLINYYINKDGQILANFDNGRSSAVGKVALFHFQNDQGLTKVGGNLFTQSANSGEPFFYKDDLGRSAAGVELLPFALEKSNVSTAEALTQLIIMQKAFGANAKSITTGDQLIQTALKMV